MTFAGHIIKTDGTYQDIPLLAYRGHIPRQSSVLTLPKEISCINVLVAGRWSDFQFWTSVSKLIWTCFNYIQSHFYVCFSVAADIAVYFALTRAQIARGLNLQMTHCHTGLSLQVMIIFLYCMLRLCCSIRTVCGVCRRHCAECR